jgi:hypothetical protein
MDNDWLEYKLMTAEDALIDQRTLTTKNATAVDKVKVVLQEKEGRWRRRTVSCRRCATP